MNYIVFKLTFLVLVFSIEKSRGDNDRTSILDINCEAGWKRFKNEKCFHIPSNDAQSYDDAKEQCADLGGRLASIHSDEEHQFVHAYAKELEKTSTWLYLGAKRASASGSFVWEDGTTWDDIKWDADYPKPDPYNCIFHYINGDSPLMISDRCDVYYERQFVCEKEAPIIEVLRQQGLKVERMLVDNERTMASLNSVVDTLNGKVKEQGDKMTDMQKEHDNEKASLDLELRALKDKLVAAESLIETLTNRFESEVTIFKSDIGQLRLDVDTVGIQANKTTKFLVKARDALRKNFLGQNVTAVVEATEVAMNEEDNVVPLVTELP